MGMEYAVFVKEADDMNSIQTGQEIAAEHVVVPGNVGLVEEVAGLIDLYWLLELRNYTALYDRFIGPGRLYIQGAELED